MDRFRGARALVLDDNATARQALAGMLAGLSARAESVESDACLLEMLERASSDGDPYRFMFVEVDFDGGRGFDVVERLRQEFDDLPRIIMSIPPGKTLFVVISRSLWECHIKAQPRSLAGLGWRLTGFRVVQLVAGVGAPVKVLLVQACIAPPRRLASGPKYGVPPYQAPLVKTFGSGSVAGPPAGTSPNGFTCTGLL